jgi:hypothetical protein
VLQSSGRLSMAGRRNRSEAGQHMMTLAVDFRPYFCSEKDAIDCFSTAYTVYINSFTIYADCDFGAFSFLRYREGRNGRGEDLTVGSVD